MFKRINKSRHKCRQAFTLVELIVVLVILAVLAAILVPALTGYIKRAKRDKHDEEAHYALVAAQSVIVEYYGKGNIAGNGVVNQQGQTGGGGSCGDIRWDNGKGCDKDTNNEKFGQAWGEEVLRLMDRDRSNQPYILVFGTGRANSGLPDSACYTVYYIAYVADKNSPAVFYINGEWQYTYPTDGPNPAIKKHDSINWLQTPDGEIPLQFYVVSQCTNNNDNFWYGNDDTLKGHSEPYFNG